MARPTQRCYLVHARAGARVSQDAANSMLNDYIGDRSRGICVYHDHFIGEAGGLAVFDVRTDSEVAKLDDPGPLRGWDLTIHPLAFSLNALGFAGQIDFTLKNYADTSLAQLEDSSAPKKRDWWRRHQ